MKPFRADLHTHTTCSDGSFTPFELLERAKEIGLQGISITDHDTIDAYDDDLFQKAKELSITLLPGVEISSRLHTTDVHILGYGFDHKSSHFLTFLEKVRSIRNERNEKILEKFKENGIVLSLKELAKIAKGNVIGRPHIAELLYRKGYVKSQQDAFDRYLHDRGPCWAPSPKFSPIEVIGQIHLAKGKAVIAHPFFIKKKKVVDELLSLPFDGIEARYAKLFPEQERPWIEIAKKKNWIVTGGSDFHGEYKPQIPLGCSWVGHDVIEQLLDV